MTRADLNNTLVEYAKEDLGCAKESGEAIISETLKGCITIANIGEVFQAYNRDGEQLTGAILEEQMINWLTQQYDVSAVELED
tara:strand:- start:361 stop:609 length:249 start_codon:yes stop_codon:yes gene_type:complete